MPPSLLLPELVTVVVGKSVRKAEPVGLYTGVGVPPPILTEEQTLALGSNPERLTKLEDVEEELTLGDPEKDGEGVGVEPTERVGRDLAVTVTVIKDVNEGVGRVVLEKVPFKSGGVPVADLEKLNKGDCEPQSALAEGRVVLERDKEDKEVTVKDRDPVAHPVEAAVKV